MESCTRRSSQGGGVADAGSWVVTPYGLVSRYSQHFRRKSLRGGVGSGAVRGESVLVGGLRAAIGGKQYDAPGSYTTTT
jgi:hypothetical protein